MTTKTRNRIISVLLTIVIIFSTTMCAQAAEEPVLDVKAKSAILMCIDTGDILYESNSHEKLHPASVTKIMSMLLIVEAIDSGKLKLDQEITPSLNAIKKGGSQIWLKENEKMTVTDLLKATAVGSANDACTALGEAIAGSEEEFVNMMNKRAKELGMNDTHFENCTGLDDTATNHLTSAYDIAIMSIELMKHEMIKDYTTIWMDTLRNGATQLTNTNKLIRFYEGATGLKTGTTNKAGSCLSATATRNGLSLVAVVMGAATSDDRFEGAKTLLNYGFAKYELYKPSIDSKKLANINIKNGVQKTIKPNCTDMQEILIEKGISENIKTDIKLPKELTAPIEKNQTIGEVIFSINGKEIQKLNLRSPISIENMTFSVAFIQVFKNLVS